MINPFRYLFGSKGYSSWHRLVVKDGTIACHDGSAPGVAQLLRELTKEGKILAAGKVEALVWFRPALG